MRRDLLHARGEIARLDALRGRREIAEWLGDAACGPVGKKRHDADEAEPEKDEDADERALRLIDTRRRDENREEAGVLPRVPEHAEDAVVVGMVRGHVLDEDIAWLRVDLGDARKQRAFAKVDGRSSDLAVPDEGKVRVGPCLDALQKIRAEDVARLHHPDGILVGIADDVNGADHEALRLIEEDRRLLDLGLRERDELRLERVARPFLGGRDDPSVVVGNAHIADSDARLHHQEEVRQPIGVALLGELPRGREACHEARRVRREHLLVVDLVERDVGEDAGLIGKLAQDQLVRLVDRDRDDHHERKDAHQHVSADERPEQARCEELIHSPS